MKGNVLLLAAMNPTERPSCRGMYTKFTSDYERTVLDYLFDEWQQHSKTALKENDT
jgi:hypothetical protein